LVYYGIDAVLYYSDVNQDTEALIVLKEGSGIPELREALDLVKGKIGELYSCTGSLAFQLEGRVGYRVHFIDLHQLLDIEGQMIANNRADRIVRLEYVTDLCDSSKRVRPDVADRLMRESIDLSNPF
jgi:hypothetical protein